VIDTALVYLSSSLYTFCLYMTVSLCESVLAYITFKNFILFLKKSVNCEEVLLCVAACYLETPYCSLQHNNGVVNLL
jgi:hypothetical protein